MTVQELIIKLMELRDRGMREFKVISVDIENKQIVVTEPITHIISLNDQL